MAQEGRMTNRLARYLKARLPELKLDEIEDSRCARGKRWPLDTLLVAMVVGMAAGRKSLAETEKLTDEMSLALRRLLGLRRRVPDTTMRDALGEIDPGEARRALHAQIKAAHRRKALTPVGLPFGVLAIDGKSSTSKVWDDYYAQRHTHDDGKQAVGLVRTMTCSLVTATAKPCVDAIPIPAKTNEMGQLSATLEILDETYGGLDLFRLITYDAGACSEENAENIRAKNWHYLFAVKASQPQSQETLQRLLGDRGHEAKNAETVDVLNNDKLVVRRLYVMEKQPLYRWHHARTFLRVESETVEGGKVTAYENRYFISSLPRAELTDAQWLHVVRLHWAVENNCHGTWDIAFEEDDHPWIQSHPRAMVVLMVLRRIAYNLLALFRSVTQRSDDKRQTPWKDILRWVYNMAIGLTDAQLITAPVICREAAVTL